MQGTNRRILIIDDNRSIHDDFKKILHVANRNVELDQSEAELFGATAPQSDYDLDSAYQGEQGYQKVVSAVKANAPYALAFVDMRMPPGWDGLQTIDKIWDADSAIQIVICTAFSDHAWEEILAHFGSNDRLLILKKPFDPSEVSQMASALTEKWHQSKNMKAKLKQMNEWVAEKGAQLDKLLVEKRKSDDLLRTCVEDLV